MKKKGEGTSLKCINKSVNPCENLGKSKGSCLRGHLIFAHLPTESSLGAVELVEVDEEFGL